MVAHDRSTGGPAIPYARRRTGIAPEVALTLRGDGLLGAAVQAATAAQIAKATRCQFAAVALTSYAVACHFVADIG